MLSLFKNLFTKTEEKPFHPGIFRNPLAEKVSWQPQKSGGSNFKNFKLVLNGSRSLIYKPTTVSYFVSSLFLIGPFIYFIFFLAIKPLLFFIHCWAFVLSIHQNIYL